MTRLGHMIYWCCFAIVSFVCFAISFYFFAPMSLWAEYYSINPVSDEFVVGDQPYFISEREIFRESTLEFNDVIFCREDDELDFNSYAYFVSGRAGIPPTNGRSKMLWPYDHSLNQAGSCYMHSTITLDLPFGVHKRQTIVGPIFKVVEAEP